MLFAVEATPALALLFAFVWEVYCFNLGVRNSHRGFIYCIAALVWAAYYAVVGIRDFANHQHAIAIVAIGVAVMASSLARKALKLGSDEELATEEHRVGRHVVGVAGES